MRIREVRRSWMSAVLGATYSVGERLMDKAASAHFSARLGSIGENHFVAYPVFLRHPECVTVGKGFWAGPSLRVEAWREFQSAKYSPRIAIGDNVIVNYFVHIGAINAISIGNDVLIGSGVLITDHSHGTVEDLGRVVPRCRSLVSKGPVRIEDNVWIGEHACILGGVTIGENAIIGANTVVTRDVAPGAVVGGSPARLLTLRDQRRRH